MGQQQPVTDNKRFGKYLRMIREERRLSLDAVEEMSLGLPERVTKSHLSRIENGQAIPTFPRMFTLSQIYGVPVSFLAERFELCLKQGMFPPNVARRATSDILDEAKKLRRSGRHAEALLLYESLLERTEGAALIDLKLECINCLVKLARYNTAKEECEKLLGPPRPSSHQLVVTLQYFAISCYRLSKFTVAMMAIDRAEAELGKLEDSDRLGTHLIALKGNLLYVTGRFEEAAKAFRAALEKFRVLADPFEACRTQLNLAATLIEIKSYSRARVHLNEVLQQAEASGYDRQQAFALSHLALLAYREDNLESAEAHCLRSNRLARPREYISILFRNCYYLWKIAQTRRDVAGIKANERTLRTYLNRVEDYVPEVEEFSAFLGGGRANE